MTVYSYLVVEGPHDVAFVGKVLREHGFSRTQLYSSLDNYWRELVPKTYPHRDDLLARVPVPQFFSGANHSVAVHAAAGMTEIVDRIEETLTQLAAPPTGIGAILDADSSSTAADRKANVVGQLQARNIPVATTSPCEAGACAVYVLPDDSSPGTLETLLVDCAQVQYPTLFGLASSHVAAVLSNSAIPSKEQKDIKKPAGVMKATVASMASVLKPGKAVQVSIEDNAWVATTTLSLPRISSFVSFLRAVHCLP